MFQAVGHIFRLVQASYVMAREGVFSDVDASMLPPPARAPLALAKLIARRTSGGTGSRLTRAMARLGPSYVKLGQFLATRPDIVGMNSARELEALQDRMPPFPRDEAVRVIERSFDKKLADIYADFSEPVAAASIAQVHKATVSDATGTREVAVKVLRPGIERRFARDLTDMFFAARIAERWSAEARRLRFIGIVETLARTVRMEMDFRLEAAAASEFGENVAKDHDFRVPDVDWNLTAKDVLTLEWIDGVPLSDIAALERSGFDRRNLGRIVIQSFLTHAVRDGLFHADMHQGNLFIDRDSRLVAVDFGIMGRLGPKERRFLAEILFGFITRNYQRVAEVHFEAGYVPSSQRVADFAQAIRAIGEPIHSRKADEISMAKLLTLLFEITALFEMKTRTELVMLQKTMVVVEGVARSLDPHLDMWATAEPVIGEWIKEKLGPVGIMQEAGRGVTNLGKIAFQLPDLLDRAEALVRRLNDDQFLFDSERALEKAAASAGEHWKWMGIWTVVILLVVALMVR
ncbi:MULTISPECIES: 2-polyprenylphenol 6-hydroxylase [unclassified Beijerinckia]|uniref:2-polyprenylphenol 6-hydroxylase n=1 Tax=unclassified Beijerinckia TaxID=2638183 RepID=UPI000894C7E1|nr:MULTISPECIES: 2-polyprenylphenol 6-hydroxylase [unclassified Beijerinckia]MDH7797934.1 ubiquinone biosynthesis protein [Beijerinckia sp. GAS462]SED03323.1 2-octaprenylphenol hydroxylase [Beijerinckia sp. 28-YEA-48]